MKRKDKPLIELIQSVRLDGQSPEFTENVISFLKEEAAPVEEMNVILKHYLKRNVLPEVCDDFSTKTMDALENRLQAPDFEPLVSKKTRTVVIILFAVGYSFLLLDELFLNLLYVADISLLSATWLIEVLNIPTIVWISVFSLTILLLLDLNVKGKKNLVP